MKDCFEMNRTPEQFEIERLKLELWRKSLELEAIVDHLQKLKESLTFFLGLDKLSDRITDIDRQQPMEDPRNPFLPKHQD